MSGVVIGVAPAVRRGPTNTYVIQGGGRSIYFDAETVFWLRAQSARRAIRADRRRFPAGGWPQAALGPAARDGLGLGGRGHLGPSSTGGDSRSRSKIAEGRAAGCSPMAVSKLGSAFDETEDSRAARGWSRHGTDHRPRCTSPGREPSLLRLEPRVEAQNAAIQRYRHRLGAVLQRASTPPICERPSASSRKYREWTRLHRQAGVRGEGDDRPSGQATTRCLTSTVIPEVPPQAVAVQPVVPAAGAGDSGSTPMCAAS
jgi:hypothetical protein